MQVQVQGQVRPRGDGGAPAATAGGGGAPPPLRDEEPERDAGTPGASPLGAGNAGRGVPVGVVGALGVAGALETGYLAVESLTGGSVACPLGGGGCADVLSSAYGSLFGLPLSVFGVAAYSGAVVLAAAMSGSDAQERALKVPLLMLASGMAGVSAYLMAALALDLGVPCPYCYASAALSAGLLAATASGFTRDELVGAGAAGVGGLAAVGAVAVVSLGGDADGSALLGKALGRGGDSGITELAYYKPEVAGESSARDVALAKHLKAAGARMYGAFWCSHCAEQKGVFGAEAAAELPYVECYPDGWKSGMKIAPACDVSVPSGTDPTKTKSIEGFPTWVVDGQMYSGIQTKENLAKQTGFTWDGGP